MTYETIMLRGTISIITIDLVDQICAQIDAFVESYEAFAKAIADRYANEIPREEVVRICYSLRQLHSVHGLVGLREFGDEMRRDLAQPMFPMLTTEN
jgi:hypothetical protein